MPKITVLMPVYNTKEEYLKEAIESILNQTFQDFEFLIVDDGSDKKTIFLLEEYAEKNSKIRIIKSKHKGVSAARNLGFINAKGEYIALMDSDDISFPKRLEKQNNFMDNNPDISISSTWYETFPKKKIEKLPEVVNLLTLLSGCRLACPSSIFRKKDIEKYNLYFDETLKLAEDYELWIRASKVTKLANIQEVLLQYRMTKNSLSRKNLAELKNVSEKIQKDLLNFLEKDKKKQKKLYKEYGPKTITFLENIFSVKNKWYKNSKYKILTILGIKIKIKKIN